MATAANTAGISSCAMFVCTDITKHPATKKEEKETVAIRRSYFCLTY